MSDLSHWTVYAPGGWVLCPGLPTVVSARPSTVPRTLLTSNKYLPAVCWLKSRVWIKRSLKSLLAFDPINTFKSKGWIFFCLKPPETSSSDQDIAQKLWFSWLTVVWGYPGSCCLVSWMTSRLKAGTHLHVLSPVQGLVHSLWGLSQHFLTGMRRNRPTSMT